MAVMRVGEVVYRNERKCVMSGVLNVCLMSICLVSVLAFTAQAGSRDVFRNVKDALVIVQCDTSTGSGFVVTMEEGKKFFVTNKHVVEGQKRVAAFLLNGKQLKLGQFYRAAKDEDLVRFEIVDAEQPSLTMSKEEPNVGDEIYIFGNSDGAGVATDITGKINGVGPDEIEVDAAFVHGNSGSAVLASDGSVVGVATYAIKGVDPKDWVKTDTRYAKVRRFALRLLNVSWRAERYATFYARCIKEIKKHNEEMGILPQVEATFVSPKIYFTSDGWSGDFLVMSDIKLSLRGTQKSIKNPVVRVCILVQGVTGTYYMRDCIIDKVGSLRYVRSCPPIYTYGNARNGYQYRVGNSMSAYYLEGLSYYQKTFPSQLSRLGVKYFDKSKDAVSGHCLFRIGRSICGDKPPKVVCFRFECWQNGSLAGEYDSDRPAKLNAMDIPVDWFIRGKYPMKFDY